MVPPRAKRDLVPLVVLMVAFFDDTTDATMTDTSGIQWLGDACSGDDDCNDTFNLECDDRGHCACKPGYTSVQFSCKKASRLGESCMLHSQCQYYDTHSSCDVSGHCACIESFQEQHLSDNSRKCQLKDADVTHYTSYSTGLLSFGLFVLVLTVIVGITCLLKFMLFSWSSQQPTRKYSRKFSYLTMNYFRAPGTLDETTALLQEGKHPPSYLEATRVPQITITDYSAVSRPTMVYTSP